MYPIHLEQVKRFCNHAIWLDKGTVKEIGNASIILDMYEEFMDAASTNDNIVVEKQKSNSQKEEEIKGNVSLEVEEKKLLNVMGYIGEVGINKTVFNTFNTLEITIEYEMLEEVSDILLGVAILTKEKRRYIFGPNTYLEKVEIPNSKGKHIVKYTIPKLNLLSGSYTIDVGLFNNKGLVCIDYKEDEISFSIVNKYFSEGLCYLEHEWKVKK